MGVLQRYRSKGSKHALMNRYEYGLLKGPGVERRQADEAE